MFMTVFFVLLNFWLLMTSAVSEAIHHSLLRFHPGCKGVGGHRSHARESIPWAIVGSLGKIWNDMQRYGKIVRTCHAFAQQWRGCIS